MEINNKVINKPTLSLLILCGNMQLCPRACRVHLYIATVIDMYNAHHLHNCQSYELLPTAVEPASVQKQRRQLTSCFADRTWGASLLHRNEFISNDH